MSTQDVNCDEAKFRLITEILNIDCNDLPQYEVIKKRAAKPISQHDHQLSVSHFNRLFPPQQLRIATGFKVLESEINRVVDENSMQPYLHIFFTGEKTLSLVFRFSDTADFEYVTDGLNVGNNCDYELNSNGYFTKLTDSKALDDLVEKYTKGEIYNYIISALNNVKSVPGYISYEMRLIKLFKKFEHELLFNTVCLEYQGKMRLGLDLYVVDSQRIHHVEYDAKGENLILVKKGYYDLGNLKP